MVSAYNVIIECVVSLINELFCYSSTNEEDNKPWEKDEVLFQAIVDNDIEAFQKGVNEGLDIGIVNNEVSIFIYRISMYYIIYVHMFV
jgi:hypothetical protein